MPGFCIDPAVRNSAPRRSDALAATLLVQPKRQRAPEHAMCLLKRAGPDREQAHSPPADQRASSRQTSSRAAASGRGAGSPATGMLDRHAKQRRHQRSPRLPALLESDNLSHDPHGAVVTALIEEQSRRIVGPSSLRRRRTNRATLPRTMSEAIVRADRGEGSRPPLAAFLDCMVAAG
jgi:hypothetical protein